MIGEIRNILDFENELINSLEAGNVSRVCLLESNKFGKIILKYNEPRPSFKREESMVRSLDIDEIPNLIDSYFGDDFYYLVYDFVPNDNIYINQNSLENIANQLGEILYNISNYKNQT